MKQLADTDLMPFGKWSTKTMQDVPVYYLNWLWNNGLKEDMHGNVADYIRRNLNALKLEDPDKIW